MLKSWHCSLFPPPLSLSLFSHCLHYPLTLFPFARYREPHSGSNTDTVSNQFPLKLGITGEDRKTRVGLADMINDSRSEPVPLIDVFPRYVRVPASDKVERVNSLST